MSNFRLLQLVMFAACCLLVLKSTALIFSGPYVLSGAASLNAQEVKADAKTAGSQEAADDSAVPKDMSPAPPPEQKVAAANIDKNGPPVKAADKKDQKVGRDPKPIRPTNFNEYKVVPSESEMDLLESLAVRRKSLNDREAALKLKENLLFAAQRQIDDRINQLKELEAKIQSDLESQDVLRQKQYHRLVKMYSSMKAKDAARIFDGLDMGILVDLLRAMKAASGSQIVAKMNPEKAREVTMLLAKKDQMVAAKTPEVTNALPRIDGVRPAEKNQ